jgi:2-keto-4-pentenoate hydratase
VTQYKFTVVLESLRNAPKILRASEFGAVQTQGRKPVSEGIGAASLGHLANAVAWLVNEISEYGAVLEPGDIVMSRALARMLPSKPVDQFLLEYTSVPALRVRFLK